MQSRSPPGSTTPSTPPPSLSLCAKVAQQVEEIRLLPKRHDLWSVSPVKANTLRITSLLFVAATKYENLIFQIEQVVFFSFGQIKYELGVNMHSEPANTEGKQPSQQPSVERINRPK